MSRWIKNWFSNYEPFDSPLIYQNLAFRSPETFYQAMKTPKDLIEIRKRISLMQPWEAKRFWRSKRHKKLYMRDDWFDINLAVMEYAIDYKFAPGTSWAKMLLECNDAIIEVNNWHDNYWGACVCNRCKDKPKHNYLGKMLNKKRRFLHYESVTDEFQRLKRN